MSEARFPSKYSPWSDGQTGPLSSLEADGWVSRLRRASDGFPAVLEQPSYECLSAALEPSRITGANEQQAFQPQILNNTVLTTDFPISQENRALPKL